MFYTMNATATPFDADAPEGSLRPIIRYKPDEPGKKELINAVWGTNPRFSDGIAYRFVQSEGKAFPSHRCLMPASEIRLKINDKHYRVTLEDGNWFYIAGVWEPALGDWPLAFKVVTVEANPEIARYQQRQDAIILRRQVMEWLDNTTPLYDLLVTPPARTFIVEDITREALRVSGQAR